jgi:hypothetical protein
MAAMEGAGSVAGAIDPSLEPAARFVAGVVTGGRPAAPTQELANMVRVLKTTKGGVQVLSDLLKKSGMDDTEIQGNLAKLNMDAPGTANLMDVNPAALQAGERVYAKGDTGKTLLNKALTEREAGTSGRVEADLRSTLGPRVNKTAQLDALKQRLEAATEQQRASHAQQQQPVESQGIVDEIDADLANERTPGIRNKLQQIRDSLHVWDQQGKVGGVLDPSSKPVLSTRQAIKDMINDAKQAGRSHEYGLLSKYYDMINKQLDPANPALRAADAEIAAVKKEEEAFDFGRKNVITKGDETFSPEEFAGKWNTMGEAERAQARAGLTRKIDQMVGLKSNDRVALKEAIAGKGKWNHQKIAQIIGQENADKLVGSLEREATFQNTANRVMQNSKTAETYDPDKGHPVAEGVKSIATKVGAGAGLGGWAGALGGLVLGGVHRGASAIGDAVTASRRTELARLLASGHTDEVMRAIAAMRNVRGLQGMQPDRMLGVIGAAGASQDREDRR